MTNREILYNTAKACLGEDMSNDPTIPQEVSCAVAVNAVFKRAFGTKLGGGASTAAMYKVLQTDPRFEQMDVGLPGDILISATGTSSKGSPHGHVSIMGYHGIMSNNSMNGLWEQYYTLESWRHYYSEWLGFPMVFFRVV